ncbi:hypothetical protein BO91_01250 [Candidatus Synechococcus spongiarum LMB bulk10E]|uniref:DUF2808 domain-containing protein n=3 Tax=Candidatus Synechococcus spongiarum TaxID=431041 RepID=A0A1T1D0R6_9SYNE|nr:MAG: hypothetical protein TQ37_04130 [Candidatus Synechococcus spongiarum 15L]MCY4359129.1 DUF2808 domain-containing protein [Cyanobacteria bacterium MAG APA_bin_95]OOV34437.1 hypothetical protein BV61_02765 [Candidatus Synechococcus spongiarum LMB bulk15M]OOV34692.1 hypothetical protein BO91_01250 [Candidatus Synechococcus spongiarum LMB bulk10E]
MPDEQYDSFKIDILTEPVWHGYSPSTATGCFGFLFMNRFLALAAGLVLIPFSAPSLAQNSLLEFRWRQDPGYVGLDYRISNSEARRRSNLKLILPGKIREHAILEMTIVAPEIFEKWRGRIDVDSMKIGYDCIQKSVFAGTRTRCENYFNLSEVTQVGPGIIRMTPDAPIPQSRTIVVELKMRNPRTSGLYQFNGYASAPGQMQIPAYQGSWLVEID